MIAPRAPYSVAYSDRGDWAMRDARLEWWPRGREQTIVRVSLLGKTYMLSLRWLQDNAR